MKEIRQKIREYGKKIGVDDQQLEKSLSEVHTYQQLVDLEQKFFATKWEETEVAFQKERKSKEGFKVGFIFSLIVVIILLGGLGYMMLKRKKSEE